jgi:hypothetical protein
MDDRLVGYHGGLTDQERLIPVLVHEPAIVDRHLTSQRESCDLCLYPVRLMADDGRVEKRPPIYRQTCARCERPALTFDARDRALCARHATSFIAAPTTVDGDEDDDEG